MRVVTTALPEVLLIEPPLFRDERGWFMELFHDARMAELRLPAAFAQDNLSRSTRNVLRGLHYQLEYPQAKLISCCDGEIYDVAVDIRRGSPTFGRWIGVTLSSEDPRQLWIPSGFAHGFCVTSDRATVLYKCTVPYAPADDYGILWEDPTLGITWPVAAPMLSERDRRHPTLAQAEQRLPVYRAPGAR